MLDNVKPGDVLMRTSNHGRALAIDTVERVTPSGRIILKGGSQVDPNGRERGRSTWTQRSWWVPTEQDRERYNIQRLRDRARTAAEGAKWESMTAAQCTAILEALKPAEKE